jgi:hypothetical protein
MYQTVEGIYENGKITLTETPVANGKQKVLVTFLESISDEPQVEPGNVEDDPLFHLHEYAVHMGIEDLSTNHDHYIYGTPKRDE